MKKFLIFSIVFISVFNFAQEKPIKLGFFTSVDANIGLDLGDIIRSNQAKTDYEKVNFHQENSIMAFQEW